MNCVIKSRYYIRKEGKKSTKKKYIGQQILRAVIADVSGIANIITDIADIATDIMDIVNIVDIAVETGRHV